MSDRGAYCTEYIYCPLPPQRLYAAPAEDGVDALCEVCRARAATVLVTFVAPNHSSARMCEICLASEMEHYRRMGKPGQVSIMPITAVIPAEVTSGVPRSQAGICIAQSVTSQCCTIPLTQRTSIRSRARIRPARSRASCFIPPRWN